MEETKVEQTKVEKKWYVVRAVSGQENKIKAYIENEISRLGLEDFCRSSISAY